MSVSGDVVIQTLGEWVSLRNRSVLFLDIKEVNKNITLQINDLIENKKFESLDVILQTPGGDIDAAFLITKLIRKRTGDLSIFVPLYAKSAGTLICLSADHLFLTDLSELGPLDTQIGETQDGGQFKYVSALNGFKALEQVQLHSVETLDIATRLILSRSPMKISEAVQLATTFCGETSGKLYQKLDPYKIGENARALGIGEFYGITILNKYRGWEKRRAERIVKTMVTRYPSHEFIIDLEELVELGMPAELIQNNLNSLIKRIRKLMLSSAQSRVELSEITVSPQPQPSLQTQGVINCDINDENKSLEK